MSTATRTRHTTAAALLTVLVTIQALSGLGGGAFLVLDPSGSLIGMPTSVLRVGPFTDFLIPGLALFLLLGVLPVVVAVGLWTRRAWPALTPLERAFGVHWSWLGAGAVGIGLAIFLAVELWVVGPSSLLIAYAVLAAAIVALALMPSTRRTYRVRASGRR